jgi:hypothetical protein
MVLAAENTGKRDAKDFGSKEYPGLQPRGCDARIYASFHNPSGNTVALRTKLRNHDLHRRFE